MEISLPALQGPEQSQLPFADRPHALLAFVCHSYESNNGWCNQDSKGFHSKERTIQSALQTQAITQPGQMWGSKPQSKWLDVPVRTLGSVCAAAPRELALRCSGNGCFHSRGAGVHLRMQTCRLRLWRHNAEVVRVMEQRAIGQKSFQFSFGIYLLEGCWCCFIFRLDLSKTSIKFIPARAWTILYGERSIY